MLVGYVVPFAIALSTGTHTNWFPNSSCITKPLSIVFIYFEVPTLNPAGICATSPFASVYSCVSVYILENVSNPITFTVVYGVVFTPSVKRAYIISFSYNPFITSPVAHVPSSVICVYIPFDSSAVFPACIAFSPSTI